MTQTLNILAVGFRDWGANDWALLMAGFFVGAGYLLKIWKGDTSATLSASDVIGQLTSLTSKVDTNAQAIAAAHKRADAAGLPSAAAVAASPEPIELPQVPPAPAFKPKGSP